ERLVGQRVAEIKKGGGVAAAALTPANTKSLAPLAAEAGLDILVIQSTVTTARHISKSGQGLNFSELRQAFHRPILVGNCVSYSAVLELMRTGIDGVLVGVGPGAACTSREVLGIGVPQVTAILDTAAAREQYFRETGRYVSLIADGGISNGGDFCKAIACGADAVMVGSLLARAKEAPGRGYQWGMATSHAALPRGTRIKVNTVAPTEQILFGPASVTDGSQNLVGALRTAMGVCGALTLRDFQKVDMVIAPSIKTEGKGYQLSRS
ncbi:MAG: IMP dehydrogenase, partial [Chloroflexota bacterium]